MSPVVESGKDAESTCCGSLTEHAIEMMQNANISTITDQIVPVAPNSSVDTRGERPPKMAAPTWYESDMLMYRDAVGKA